MVLDDIEVTDRIDSPDNLVNRLRALTRPAKSLNNLIPTLPPTADDVISNLDEKLSGGSIKSKASKILLDAMNALEQNIESIDKPEKLARVAESMNKIIEAHTPKKETGPLAAQIIIYSPTPREEKEYPIIDVRRLED